MRWKAGGGLLLVVLLLAGCSGGAEPAPTATATVVPSATVAATAAAVPSATPAATATMVPSATPPATATVAPSPTATASPSPQALEPAAEWEAYAVPDAGVSLRLPERFLVLNLSADQLDQIVALAEDALPAGALAGMDLKSLFEQNIRLFAIDREGLEQTGGTFAPNVNVLVQPTGPTTLDAVMDANEEALASIGVTTVAASERIEVDGEEAGLLDYDLPLSAAADAPIVHVRQVLLLVGGNLNVVTITYPLTLESDYAPLVEEIIAQLSLLSE